ncbi:MAG: SprT-like domain-containing protein [Candidatus Altiarchaeota archaeon]
MHGELRMSFRRVNEKYFNNRLAEGDYTFSWKKLSGTYASVEYTKEKSRIRVNPVIKDDEELLDYVMLHEILHTIRGFRRIRTHRGKFNDRMKELLGEDEFRRLEEKLDSMNIRQRTFGRRYVYKCPKCGQKIVRKKKVKDTSCSLCDKRYNPKYRLELVEGYYTLEHFI